MLDEVDWLIARRKSQRPSEKPGSGEKPFHTDAVTVGTDASLPGDGTNTPVIVTCR